jgi:hypothetical protein
MQGRASSRCAQRLAGTRSAVASALGRARPGGPRGSRPSAARAVRLLLALAAASTALLALSTAAQSEVGVPVEIDSFGNAALPASPFTRTVIQLPAPGTTLGTPQGTFSESGGVGTMNMSGAGNGTSGVTLEYTPTAGGSVDLTGGGTDAQIFIDFALIDEMPAPGDTSVPGLTTYMTAYDAGGDSAISPSDAVGNYFAFNAAFPFTGFHNVTGTIDWTHITKLDITFVYPTTNTGGGSLEAQVNRLWATPESGSQPDPPTPTVTAPSTATGTSTTVVDFTVSFASDGSAAPVTYDPPSDIGVRPQDLQVGGTAFGTATPSVTVSGGPSTYTVGVSGMTQSGAITVDVPSGIVDDAWTQLNNASSNDPSVTFTYGVPCSAGTYSASGVTPCTNTPAGTYIPGTGATGPGGACPAGTYSPAGATSCTDTPAGTYIPGTGATGPGSACPAGTYSSSAGASSCTPTPPGTSIGGPGATGPGSACAAGTYAASSAQSCTPASPGYYVGATGQSSQTACPAGYYQPSSGQTSCIPAGLGYFVASGGQTAEVACPAGETTLAVASTTCVGPTTLVAANVKKAPGFVTLSARLTESLDGKGVGGQTIVFTIGSATLCSAVTSASGTASCTALLTLQQFLSASSYTATYAGRAPYLGTKATGGFYTGSSLPTQG